MHTFIPKQVQHQTQPSGSFWVNRTIYRSPDHKRPVFQSLPEMVQAKLEVSQPGDEYEQEQEADRIAEQVMRMPESNIACACGGGCPRCQREQPGRLQTKQLHSGSRESIEIPQVIHDVLDSSGQQLDSSAATFFGSRFEHDFTRVRVHADERADDAAKAIEAKAFTVGDSIVFGAGQYSPASTEGRLLLAHELTHIVQQGRLSNAMQLSLGGSVIQRSPDKPVKAKPKPKPKQNQRIDELAKWPEDARRAWRRLSPGDHDLVVAQMGAKYGAAFARDFLKLVNAGKPKDDVNYYYGPGVGPQPEKLIASGYKLAQKDSVHEWWVHPSGKSVTRNYTESKPSTASSEDVQPEPSDMEEPIPEDVPEMKQPDLSPEDQPITPRCQEVENLTKNICENADRICTLAADLNDEQSQSACERAENNCTEAVDRSNTCIAEELQ